jgi:cardiolipin synthase
MTITLIILSLFGIIGIIATITTLSILFSSIGKNVSEFSLTEVPPPVTTDQFLSNIATTSGGHRCYFNTDTTEIIINNTTYKEQLLADITNAHHTIAIQTYVWDNDEDTEDIFSALTTAVSRGVQVRLLIDAQGSRLDQKRIKGLRQSGIEVQLFRPFEIGKLTLYYSRTHRRSYIFDGQIAYFGGIAMSRRWMRPVLTNDFIYQDVMYRVSGEMVERIAGAFGEIWSTYANTVAENLFVTEASRSTETNAFTLTHTPSSDIHALTSVFWYSCAAARAEITMITPYFVPGHAISEILCRQARAGVKVTVVTQGTAESIMVQYAARSYYDELLQAGVRIFEHAKPHMHAKVLVIDNAFTLCGSANVDIRSQRINLEFITGVQSASFAEENKQLVEQYKDDLVEITKDSRGSVPFYQKWIEKSSHLLSEQF